MQNLDSRPWQSEQGMYIIYLLKFFCLQSRIYNKEEVDEDEPLYVLITSNSDEDLAKGVEMIQGIIEQTDENQKYQIAVYD